MCAITAGVPGCGELVEEQAPQSWAACRRAPRTGIRALELPLRELRHHSANLVLETSHNMFMKS